MASKRTIFVAAIIAAGAAGGIASPSFAGDGAVRLDTQRLDRTTAEYSQYRGYYRGYRGGYYGGRGWYGGRGAAVAGAVGLGILGAAAIAASRPAYYDEPAYGYGAYAPVYDEPVVVYRPQPYYRGGYYPGRGPYADVYQGGPDPSRGGR